MLVSCKRLQVYNSCLGKCCTYAAIYRQCSTVSQPLVLTEQDAERQQLTQLASISDAASKVSVVSLAVCCKAQPQRATTAAAHAQASTADSDGTTAWHPSSNSNAQAFSSDPTCLSSTKQQLWAAVWSQQQRHTAPADHSTSSPASVSPTQLSHNNNQA